MGRRHLLLWLLACACATEPSYEGRLCNTASPCPSGYACGPDDRCHRGPIFDDAAAADAEPIDSNDPMDSSTFDTGAGDADPLDAGPMDATPSDAQPTDADPTDADPIDAGPMDADPMDADPPDADLPDTGEHALQVRVAGPSDDGMQDPGGPMLVAYGWISLYSLDHWGATRFTVPSVPQGAIIDGAYIDVFVDSDTEDVPNAVLFVEPTASPALITANSGDISGRALSVSSVTWISVDTGAGWARSPDLGVLVQEVVDLPGWGPGSSILFIWDTQGADSFEFRQWDYDAAGAFAAQLTIRYRVQ